MASLQQYKPRSHCQCIYGNYKHLLREQECNCMQEKNHKNTLWNSTLTVAATLCPLVLLFFYYTLFCITFSKITYVNCILRTKGLIMTCLGFFFFGRGGVFFNLVFLTVPMFRVIHWLTSKHNCP